MSAVEDTIANCMTNLAANGSSLGMALEVAFRDDDEIYRLYHNFTLAISYLSIGLYERVSKYQPADLELQQRMLQFLITKRGGYKHTPSEIVGTIN